MNRSFIGALCFSVAFTLLAGCGGTQPIGTPRAMPQSPTKQSAPVPPGLARSYRVLHDFGHGFGDEPQGTLLDVSGMLYGVTLSGGAYNKGVVYGMTTSGVEQVLYSFRGSTDGEFPNSSVVEMNGVLFGTTKLGGSYGGSYGGGTVYTVSTSSVETVLHSFGKDGDGEIPEGPLIDVNGTLYGTTSMGGKYGLGTFFSITTSGTEQVLHSFGKGTDGSQPSGSLLDVEGTLYGTTQYGGSNCGSKLGCGTVFSITPGGKEKMVHAFSGSPDGAFPSAGLIDVGGTLYGTTMDGGTNKGYAEGTVFSITRSGIEKVLHSFGGDQDGWGPDASLIDVKGVLYGTTWNGPGNCGNCGTIFSVGKAGKEQVLEGFPPRHKGRIPLGLINIDGTLYGVALAGGKYQQGIAFAFKP